MKFVMLFASLMVTHTAALGSSPQLWELVGVVFLGDQCQALNDTEVPSIVQDGDAQTLEISFGQEFNAITDSDNPRVRNRCRVEVTFRVSDHYQVAPGFAIYPGAAGISPEGLGIVTARYRLGGIESPTIVETFPGGFAGDFAVMSPQVMQLQWSQCGGEITLFADANIVVQRAPEEREMADSEILIRSVMISVDRIRRCEGV